MHFNSEYNSTLLFDREPLPTWFKMPVLCVTTLRVAEAICSFNIPSLVQN